MTNMTNYLLFTALASFFHETYTNPNNGISQTVLCIDTYQPSIMYSHGMSCTCTDTGIVIRHVKKKPFSWIHMQG